MKGKKVVAYLLTLLAVAVGMWSSQSVQAEVRQVRFDQLSTDRRNPTDVGIVFEFDYLAIKAPRTVVLPDFVTDGATYAYRPSWPRYPIQSFDATTREVVFNPDYTGNSIGTYPDAEVHLNERTEVFEAVKDGQRRYFLVRSKVHPLYVSLDLRGGYVTNDLGQQFDDVITYPVTDVAARSVHNQLPEPSRDGYIFVGWTTDPSGSIPNKDPHEESGGYDINQDTSITLYALWEKDGLEEDLYIGINPEGKKATKTDDGKAIFLVGNLYRNQFKDVEYIVYTDAALTEKVTVNTPVKWTVEAVAGFESRAAVVAKAQEMMEFKTGDTSTYVPGQTNINKATALKSGVYKVTATLENGRSDWAYLVVPGDTNRSGFLSSADITEINRYVVTKSLESYRIRDEFTLLLADVDMNGIVAARDTALVQQMFEHKIASN